MIRLATDRFKLCLFIDGLDKYDGDCEAIADLLKDVASSPHVKVCVSSRPWLVFEEAFENGVGLRLQDLTYANIRNCVRGPLEANKKMEQLAVSNPEHATALVSEIVTNANGVFLWVRLVVWSLLDGLRNRDSISDLQKRLESLLADLDAFHGFMINCINPFYMQQASRIF